MSFLIERNVLVEVHPAAMDGTIEAIWFLSRVGSFKYHFQAITISASENIVLSNI